MVLKPKMCLFVVTTDPVLDIAVKRKGQSLVGAPEVGCNIDGRIGHGALRRCDGEGRVVEDDTCQFLYKI